MSSSCLVFFCICMVYVKLHKTCCLSLDIYRPRHKYHIKSPKYLFSIFLEKNFLKTFGNKNFWKYSRKANCWSKKVGSHHSSFEEFTLASDERKNYF